MRKLSAMALLIFAPALGAARDLAPGTLQLSGDMDLSWSSNKTEITGFQDQDETTLNLSADARFYALRNFAVGLFVAFQDSSTDTGTATLDQQTIIIGPIVGANLSVSEKASLFAEGGIGYAKMEVEQLDATGFGWIVRGGVHYFVVPAVSLDGFVGYEAISVEDSSFDVKVDSGGLNVGAGFSVYFGGR